MSNEQKRVKIHVVLHAIKSRGKRAYTKKKTDVRMNNYCQLVDTQPLLSYTICERIYIFLLKHRSYEMINVHKFTWLRLRSKSHCFDYSNEGYTLYVFILTLLAQAIFQFHPLKLAREIESDMLEMPNNVPMFE